MVHNVEYNVNLLNWGVNSQRILSEKHCVADMHLGMSGNQVSHTSTEYMFIYICFQ